MSASDVEPEDSPVGDEDESFVDQDGIEDPERDQPDPDLGAPGAPTAEAAATDTPGSANSPGHAARRERQRVLPHLTQADLVLIHDEFGRAHYFTDKGRPVCGRLKKEKNRLIPDEACLGVPLANGACRVHGGKAGRPIQHGRYSRTLKKWKGAFEAARADKELTDARRDLALMDVANEKLLERAEELDCPGWREDVRRTFGELRAAIRGQRHTEVGVLLKKLGDLIERGATADQLAADLVAHVDRRANRACRVTELALRREEKVTGSEIAAIFRSWLGVLERNLEPQVYFRLVPELRKVSTVGVEGGAAESE